MSMLMLNRQEQCLPQWSLEMAKKKTKNLRPPYCSFPVNAFGISCLFVGFFWCLWDIRINFVYRNGVSWRGKVSRQMNFSTLKRPPDLVWRLVSFFLLLPRRNVGKGWISRDSSSWDSTRTKRRTWCSTRKVCKRQQIDEDGKFKAINSSILLCLFLSQWSIGYVAYKERFSTTDFVRNVSFFFCLGIVPRKAVGSSNIHSKRFESARACAHPYLPSLNNLLIPFPLRDLVFFLY